MLNSLIEQPEAVTALQNLIADLDACFLHGFASGQNAVVQSLPQIFNGTPLQSPVEECAAAIMQNTFSETHFVTLAAARSALQGTLYDALRQQALTALGRTDAPDPASAVAPKPVNTDPLLDSTRHWLMELAITGFARLEQGAIASFSPVLVQLRANPATAAHAASLTGFVHELMSMLPAASTDRIPVLRWCDLWCNAMLGAVGLAQMPEPSAVSGTLYPMGASLHQHPRMASAVIYAVLVTESGARFVRQTWSSFKATAISGGAIWLMFPDAQMLLEHLLKGKALTLRDMPALASGDLLWRADRAETGKKFNPLEVALTYYAAGVDSPTAAIAPLQRHPIQLAEPIALENFSVDGDTLRLQDGMTLALDTRRDGLQDVDALNAAGTLFGLLRYDDAKWCVQVLTAGNNAGKFEFAGEAAAQILKKPPKTNAVSTLQERASRLLRK